MTISEFLLSMLSGFLTSLLFLYYILLFLRPKIAIKKEIRKIPDFDDPKAICYLFKIVNLSSHAAFDVKLELTELEVIPAGEGQYNMRRRFLKLVKDDLSYIPHYTPQRKLKTFAPHCIVLRSKENLDQLLTYSNKSIQLQVTLRHGLSGLSKIFTHEYAGVNSITDGKFPFGN